MIRNLLIIVLLASRMSASCVLREGVGADFGSIGVTSEKSVGTVPRDVTMLYGNGLLSEMFVAGGDCRTSKGIGIGDAQREVQRVYGRGKKTVVYLEKGKGDRIGKLGDYVLEYPGVAFVMAEDKVAGFFIRPESNAVISLLWGAALIGAGITLFAFAPHVSRWEKHLTQVYPWTRVSGWSGTRKGVFIWRIIGVVFAISGVLLLLTDRF